MPTPHRLAALSLALLLALTVVACTSSNDFPDEFDAGPIDNFPPQSVVTFADRVEIERATPAGSTGDHLIGGALLFHLVRLQSGDFLALSARDPHSDCWAIWDPDYQLPGAIAVPDWPGWFRDPCHGGIYDESGVGVFGPIARNLDHYPVELRDGHVYVTLTEDALILGQKPPASDSTSTPTPTMTPRPVPTRPGSLSTNVPTPEPTATPVVSLTPATPTLVPGPPWTAADYFAALEEQDIEVGPTGRTVACAEVGGLTGAEYDGDANVVLWVYASAEAAAVEWHIGSYDAVHRVPDCNRPPARIYARGNLVLWVSAEDRRDEIAVRAGTTFLGLDGKPLPSHVEGSVLMPSVDGDPLSSGIFLAELRELGLPYTPYESFYCHPVEGVSLFLLAPQLADGQFDSFELRVYPTAAALEAEWGLEAGGANGELTRYRMENRLCQHPPPGTIYRNENMLLMIPGGASSLPAESEALILHTFLSLQPKRYPLTTTPREGVCYTPLTSHPPRRPPTPCK